MTWISITEVYQQEMREDIEQVFLEFISVVGMSAEVQFHSPNPQQTRAEKTSFRLTTCVIKT